MSVIDVSIIDVGNWCRSSVSVIDVSIISVGHRCVDHRCWSSMCRSPVSVMVLDKKETENFLVSMEENEEREEKYTRSALDY